MLTRLGKKLNKPISTSLFIVGLVFLLSENTRAGLLENSGLRLVQQDEMPWVVTLNGYECGGILIAPRVVLTSIPCLEANEERESSVSVNNPAGEVFVGERLSVQSYFSYPGFIEDGKINNIAVAILEQPATTAPVPIATEMTKYDGVRTVATARSIFNGYLNKNSEFSYLRNDSRQFTQAHPLLPSEKCAAGDGHTCIGTGDLPTCSAMVGSPVLIEQEGELRLLGVANKQFSCGDNQAPLVVTKIAPYLQWIELFMSGVVTNYIEGDFDGDNRDDIYVQWQEGSVKSNALLHAKQGHRYTRIDGLFDLEPFTTSSGGSTLHFEDYNFDGAVDIYGYRLDTQQGSIFTFLNGCADENILYQSQ